MLLLDSSVIFEILKASDAGASALLEINTDDVAVASLSIYEILANSRGEEYETRKTLLKNIPLLNFTGKAAIEAADIFNSLKERGKMIGDIDLFIAGIAKSNDLQLITFDKHFMNIPGLKVNVLKF